MPSDWFIAIDKIRRLVDIDTRVTVFSGSGPIARLPDPLGGDPSQWGTLTASVARGKAPLMSLLLAKAHFLMLPEPIVRFMIDSDRVLTSEAVSPSAVADTLQHSFPWRAAEMRLPMASENLARVGYDLGRQPAAIVVPYDIVSTLYHEMTHAWLWLDEFANTEIQNLNAAGVAHYTSAVGARGTSLDAQIAFTEAAAYYVEDRVTRWCRALERLNRLVRNPPASPAVLRSEVELVVDTYDTFGSMVYGVVMDERITTPELSTALRNAIDRHVLDGAPLTRPFAETPLERVRTALLGM